MVNITFSNKDEGLEDVEVGPFEWAHINSDLRIVVGPDAEEIAYLDGNDNWIYIPDGSLWTEVIIG